MVWFVGTRDDVEQKQLHNLSSNYNFQDSREGVKSERMKKRGMNEKDVMSHKVRA
jgi:hypothetical protein